MINKLLLAGDKFMPEIHLRQAGLLTVLANYLLKKIYEKFKEKRDSKGIYQNEIDKSYF